MLGSSDHKYYLGVPRSRKDGIKVSVVLFPYLSLLIMISIFIEATA
jgi:hypothetical protein